MRTVHGIKKTLGPRRQMVCVSCHPYRPRAACGRKLSRMALGECSLAARGASFNRDASLSRAVEHGLHFLAVRDPVQGIHLAGDVREVFFAQVLTGRELGTQINSFGEQAITLGPQFVAAHAGVLVVCDIATAAWTLFEPRSDGRLFSGPWLLAQQQKSPTPLERGRLSPSIAIGQPAKPEAKR